MFRIHEASIRFRNARRQLFTVHPGGELEALRAAMEDVERGLAAMGDDPIPFARAEDWVRDLRTAIDGWKRTVSTTAVPATTLVDVDRNRFYGAVDGLASWLYWSEFDAS